ncbi:LuxR C-terminal-related transcriptional regulator [Wukongibacter sp. M2B1]|uniref:helix-turn-helix domain-containing protein n=1 Tax=Wukongibacter sp. M2B1 TaxID=3088895 RepID=UPI003D7A5D7A
MSHIVEYDFDFKGNILSSWSKYSSKNMKRNISSTCKQNEPEIFETIREKYKKHITIVRKYGEKFSRITGKNFVILFITPSGTVIDIIYSDDKRGKGHKRFKLGMSFDEKKIGKNAVVLSRDSNQPVKLLPEQHANGVLEKMCEYCVPLKISGNTIGYFDFITEKSDELDTIIDIAHVFKFYTHYLAMNNFNMVEFEQVDKVSLSKRQTEVLLKMAQGMTEYAISKELDVSIDTIRFHKKNIFKKLDVNCTVQAVVKGFKGNYIYLSDV